MTAEYHELRHSALTRSSTLSTALGYARKGIPVFPVQDKRPLTPHGFEDASHDTSRVTAMFNAAPTATGYGIPTGAFSGLVVVDRDGDSPGACRIWDSLPPTLEVETSRGRHRYYRIPNGTKVRSRKLASDVDLKADGGYVVAAGSVHEGGIQYKFVEETKALGVAALPDNLLEPEPRDEASRHREGASIPVDDGGPIPEGTRNRTLTSIAGRMRARGLAQGDLEDHLLAVNAQRCTPPLGEDEVGRIAASVARYAPGDASSSPCPKVRAKLALLEDAAGERPVVGMRGGSGWSIYNAALEAARQHGTDHPVGVELSLDVRTWAQMAGTHAATVSRFVRRSPLVRQLRRGSGQRAGSVVLLLPREIGGQLQHSTPEGCSRELSVAVRPLFRTLYRLRWGPGRIGKSRAALLTKVVECPGVSRSELAQRLGRKPASLKKPLKWLVDAGLLERTGWGRYDVTDGFSKRLDDLRAVGGEPEADRLQILRHNHQREGYRNRHKIKAEAVPERTTAELERVPDPDPHLVDALRRFLRRNPRRRDENPGWFAVAIWAEGYTQTKPTPAAVEVALAELEAVAA